LNENFATRRFFPQFSYKQFTAGNCPPPLSYHEATGANDALTTGSRSTLWDCLDLVGPRIWS